jgi:hypothetical protein
MNSDLHTFVREALSHGASRDAIRAALRDARWPDDEVESALAAWHDAGLGLPVPRRRVGVSPREAFLYLLLFASLYLVAYHVGAILFAWIERSWPDAAVMDSAVDLRSEWVRFGVASLLVAFPVYLLTARITGRAVARDPEKRNSGVRRWLTYLTLFNAACVLIGDFIAVLLGLLKGELTARFMSKAAVVAAIAAWLFTHYMGGLRRDEEDAPKRATPSWLARAAGGAVVLVILLGMYIAGAPAQVRREAIDQRRVNELQTLSQHVLTFNATFKHLPRDLDELAQLNSPASRLSLTDPVRKVRYEYLVHDSSSFELCATFDASDSLGPYGPGVNPFWRHEAGHTCFTFHVQPFGGRP